MFECEYFTGTEFENLSEFPENRKFGQISGKFSVFFVYKIKPRLLCADFYRNGNCKFDK